MAYLAPTKGLSWPSLDAAMLFAPFQFHDVISSKVLGRWEGQREVGGCT